MCREGGIMQGGLEDSGVLWRAGQGSCRPIADGPECLGWEAGVLGILV